ncbi:sugar ABC transporter permease [Dietzia sp. CH92]|uniref:carbohydrate ABC transporter permease n=2 Tax=Bacteria TaxID=2 RepID=UPI0028D6F455|nr:sugar ABC transporter permease [Dietzia sp. CH92]
MFVPALTDSAPPAAPATRPGRRTPDHGGSGFSPPRVARALTPLAYVLPGVALLAIWVYKPLVDAVNLSFYDWNLMPTSPKTYVGLEKYARVLELPEIRQAVANTGLYILAAMVFLVVVPTGIVLATRSISSRAGNLYKGALFLPYLIPPVAVGAVWRWLFADETGAITSAAAAVGVDLGTVFRDQDTALWAIVIILGWQMFGFGVLMVTAGYTSIGPEYADAAAMDGANSRQIIGRVILPLLSPTLVFLGLMAVLLVAQWSFPLIDLLTQGGPSGTSTNIYYLLYDVGFRSFDSGLAAAAGTLFFVVFGLIAWAFVELSQRLSFFDD